MSISPIPRPGGRDQTARAAAATAQADVNTLKARPTVAAWVASTAYRAGQLVTYQGATYIAKADFTSGPSFNAANWDALPGSGGSGGAFRGAWAASTAYAAGDVVVQNGALFSRKTAGTSGASFAPGDWDAVGARGELAHAEVTAAQSITAPGGVSSGPDFPGLTVTFTPAGRPIIAEAYIPAMNTSVSGGFCFARITGGTNEFGRSIGSDRATPFVVRRRIAAPGTTVTTLKVQVNGSGGALNIQHGAAYPSYLRIVEL